MTISNNLFVKLKETLDKDDYTDINNLKNICFDYDKTYLKLEIDYKLNRDEKNSDNLNHINEFMLYEDNKLIGYIGIGSFGGDALEVNGMVHPDYRRKGIFTRLFSLVKDEFYKRKSNEMLLLSDNNSTGGIAFIKSLNCEYHHSEYDMNLDMNVIHEIKFDDLVFRKVVCDDINKIAKADFEFLNESDIEELLLSPTYIIKKDDALIGKTRLEINDNIGGIYGLEVLPEYRGKGYGRELLLLSIKELKEKNVEIITLQVETSNKNALNLYKTCGFKENYTMDYYRITK
ncbi:GNAT family N-acetyltransferase [Sedimentibacter sp.]|uniref:GNAT family N-acetyltransferase n=1 Tax=Sedimentibacter sp. TaxID=1960295 RepID=UPI0028AE3A1F|nr:GNAT family N-acetyltransferase [Sedimentibacter sp.]